MRDQELHPLPVRQAALRALAALCLDCPPNRAALGRVGGVAALVAMLRWTEDDAGRRRGCESVAAAAVEAVWAAVVGDKANEAVLAAGGGCGALLTLLEEAPVELRPAVRGGPAGVCSGLFKRVCVIRQGGLPG